MYTVTAKQKKKNIYLWIFEILLKLKKETMSNKFFNLSDLLLVLRIQTSSTVILLYSTVSFLDV